MGELFLGFYLNFFVVNMVYHVNDVAGFLFF